MGEHYRPTVTGYPATAGSNPQSQSNGYPAAGTAYAYAAPPPQAPFYNPNPYHGPDPGIARRATLLRRICAAILAAIVITGTIIFIMWLVLRPRIPQFRVDSLTLSNFNVSPSSLVTGNWDVRFTVRNPNSKMTLVYDEIKATMFYRFDSLAATTVPPFRQGTKNETSFGATFAASSAYASRLAVDGINGERARGTLSFNVRLFARVRFNAGALRARRRLLRVLCTDLPVGVSSNGTAAGSGSLTGGSRGCRVGF